MSKKVKAAWAVLSAICAICIALFVLMRFMSVDKPKAEIYSQGRLIRTVSLSDSCEFTIQTEHGFNTIRVADESIAVISADCPDKVCVNSGAVSTGAVPIICLPHKLEIRIVSGADDIDAQIN